MGTKSRCENSWIPVFAGMIRGKAAAKSGIVTPAEAGVQGWRFQTRVFTQTHKAGPSSSLKVQPGKRASADAWGPGHSRASAGTTNEAVMLRIRLEIEKFAPRLVPSPGTPLPRPTSGSPTTAGCEHVPRSPVPGTGSRGGCAGFYRPAASVEGFLRPEAENKAGMSFISNKLTGCERNGRGLAVAAGRPGLKPAGKSRRRAARVSCSSERLARSPDCGRTGAGQGDTDRLAPGAARALQSRAAQCYS